MRKTLFLMVSAAVLGFASCEDRKTAENNEVRNQAVSEDPARQVNPEISRLNRVLYSMSERAKAVIPNGSPEEFLADLHAVLDEEKNFPQDDLSLYHLTDKKNHLDSSYEPENLVLLTKNEFYNLNRNNLYLRADVEPHLRKMAQAAKSDGITLLVSSTYRSYEYQRQVYNRWVSIDGQELADRYSARPGTSQHQLGAAIDFGSISDDFADTPAGKWMYSHAAEYGWSLSFPQGYEDVTGYMWECWHFRYIGKTACGFQKKWFGDIQQFMLEFIDAWKKDMM